MVDDHVDRPGVEAEQSVKLTGTNRSMTHLSAAFSGKDQKMPPVAADFLKTHLTRTTRSSSFRPGRHAGGLAGLVAIARGKTPDPIPNSAVKTLSADGTAPQGAEE